MACVTVKQTGYIWIVIIILLREENQQNEISRVYTKWVFHKDFS